MAEQEVIKHTKNIFTLWGKKNSIWHKIGEFVLEILIIVFAITLSIYLHDRSVKKHQQHETKEFLLGLKEDLTTDISEMKEDKETFVKSGRAFRYVTRRKLTEKLNTDSLKAYSNYMFNTTGLVPNSGRFEGFKSSGKIGTIENKSLQDDIMDLYQEDIPNVIASTNNYTLKKQKLFDIVYNNTMRVTDSTSNITEVLASDAIFNISSRLISVDEIIGRYGLCIKRMEKIIAQINKEYPK